MNKKILASMLIIAVAAGLVGAGVVSYFSDTETSKGNVFEAGTIDIAVNGENPWWTGSATFLGVKPCETRWINFTIKNVGTNEANIWKHIIITGWGGDLGTPPYSGICSSEPEFEEGGGEFDNGVPVQGSYKPKDYLAPWIIYDLYINGQPLITEANQLRLDDIACTYIYLGKLAPGASMDVRQSYHLMTWTDSNIPMITNWAQGDWVKFDIEVIARQLTGPSPEPCVLTLENKDTTTWEPITGDGKYGTLEYNLAGDEFVYTFKGYGLDDIPYSLIYYADPYPGCHPGALIAKGTASGGLLTLSGSVDLGINLPDSGDMNYPAGAKIWLVPSTDYTEGTHSVAWDPTAFLFGMNLIHYEDTGP